MEFNKSNGIVPRSVIRPVQESLRRKEEETEDQLAVSEKLSRNEVGKLVKQLEKEMREAVGKLEFEKAALLRDQISFLEENAQGKLSVSGQGGLSGKRKFGKRRKYGKSR